MANETACSVLLVEDDEKLARLISQYLGVHQFTVTIAPRGDLALELAAAQPPDLIILDVLLPGLDGIEVCRRLRPGYAGPILMLTACGDDTHHMLGLDFGADDFVVKPIQPPVLLARMRALLRRARPVPAPAIDDPERLRFGALTICRTTRSVQFGAMPIELTTAEFDLLTLLADRAGEVVSRDDVMKALRGIDFDGLDRSVDLRISRLRKKLGDTATRPERIKTVWARGYLFNPDAWSPT